MTASTTLPDFVIFLGTTVASTETFSFLLLLIGIHFALARQLRLSLLLLVVSLITSTSVTLLKEYFAIERPASPLIEISGYGFPSGHATGISYLAFILYYYLIDFLQSKHHIGYIAVLLAAVVLVSYSRVYFSVHTYPQVAAGILLGSIMGILFIHFANQLYVRKETSPSTDRYQ